MYSRFGIAFLLEIYVRQFFLKFNLLEKSDIWMEHPMLYFLQRLNE